TWSPIFSIASAIALTAPAISCSPATSGACCEGPGTCTSTRDFFLGLDGDPDPTKGPPRSQQTLALRQAEHALARSGRTQATPFAKQRPHIGRPPLASPSSSALC